MAAELLTADALRTSRSLRPLTREEEGTDVFELPNGVFGYTYSPAQKEMPIYAKQPHNSFEVHRLKDGAVHMIGYVTPEIESKIEAKAAGVETVLYPAVYEKSTQLVSIDVINMQPAKKAISREDGNPLKTLIHPA